MNKIISFITVICGFNMAVYTQEIVADRPDQTESSITVPRKSLQIEIGAGNGNYRDERLSLIPTVLFRYGLFEKIELRFVEQIAGFENNTTSENKFGLTDIETGVKFQILRKEQVNTEIAFISHIVIPTGSVELTNNTIGTVNKLAVSHTLNKYFDLGYNLGYNYYGNDNGILTYTIVTGVALAEKIGAYVEIFGDFPDFEKILLNMDSGITYLLKDNLQLDFSIGFGLNQKMNYFSFGCSWNINLN